MKSPQFAPGTSRRVRFTVPAPAATPILCGPLSSVARRPRFALPALAVLAGVTFWTVAPSAHAADTVDAVKASPTTTAAGYGDLSVGTNYTTTITPTAATTTDVNFAAGTTYSVTTFDANGAALSFGSLDDLDATQALTLTNSSATAATLALNLGSTNATSGSNAADLLYVAFGANLSIAPGGAGTGGMTLLLTNTGSIDDVGTLSLGTPITITSGKTVTFSGTGNTTVSGAIGQTGTSNIAITDTGTTIFSGANTYTGTTTLSAGVLNAGIGDTGTGTAATAGALGAGGTITFGGGTLQYSTASGGPIIRAASRAAAAPLFSIRMVRR